MTESRPSHLSIIPAAAVFDDRIGGADLRVLCAIAAYADRSGKCWTATTTLARDLDVSDRRVRSCLRNLENCAYLETEHRPGQKSGYLVRHEPPDAGSSVSGVEEADPGRPASAPPEADAPPSIPSDGTTEQKDPVESTADEPFEEFWRIYPSRGGDSNLKQLARAKFEAALKRGVGSWAIILGARNYAATIEREDIDPKDVAPAQTWIDQCRWTQYLAAAHATVKSRSGARP